LKTVYCYKFINNMSGLKEDQYGFSQAKRQVTPDEIDRYEQYIVSNPSISATWVGTAAGGTAGQGKALVLINKNLDYPRNLLYGVVGTADMGGSWTVNGKDQFGQVVRETVVLGTAAAGTPAAAVAGTQIFAQVTSGTFTVAATGVGAGSARLGVAIGTAATAKYYLGLPSKIGAVSDVKMISWSKEHVQTTLNGGTVDATLVSTSNHAFNGTSIMGGTETFVVLFKPTHDNAGKANLTLL